MDLTGYGVTTLNDQRVYIVAFYAILCMKTALFLGAGASAFVSQPTTKKLMDLVWERIKTQESGVEISTITESIIQADYYTDIEKIYDGIDRMLRIRDTTTNVKPIVSALCDNEDTMVKSTLMELESVRDMIRDVLLASFDISESEYVLIVPMYDVVMDYISDQTDGIHVFTTNYDTVVEAYAHAKSFEIVNGFTDGGRLSRVWADHWERSTTWLPLYLTKLHGSVNWYEDADGNIVEAGVIPQRDPEHDIMIAPTEGPKDYSKEPFQSLMNHFKESIKDVEMLLVIGFSYRDEDIVDVIKDRLEHGMTLISVSPTATTDIRRVSDTDFKTVDFGDQALKTATSARIILIEREFRSETINVDILKAAHKLTEIYADVYTRPESKSDHTRQSAS